jgi:hypothetical protein
MCTELWAKVARLFYFRIFVLIVLPFMISEYDVLLVNKLYSHLNNTIISNSAVSGNYTPCS